MKRKVCTLLCQCGCKFIFAGGRISISWILLPSCESSSFMQVISLNFGYLSINFKKQQIPSSLIINNKYQFEHLPFCVMFKIIINLFKINDIRTCAGRSSFISWILLPSGESIVVMHLISLNFAHLAHNFLEIRQICQLYLMIKEKNYLATSTCSWSVKNGN